MITDITPQEMKLRTRSNLGLKPEALQFAESRRTIKEMQVRLDEYRQYWEALEDVRVRMRKSTDYARGRQLEGKVINDLGETVTEAEYISEQGKTPFVQNIIKPVMRSIEGIFRQDVAKSLVVCRTPDSALAEKMFTNALQANLEMNETREVDPRVLEYFMLSGIPAFRMGFDWVPDIGRNDVLINYPDPNYLFFNNDIQDIRGRDMRLIGQLHDMTLDELYVHFANSEEDKAYLRRLFRVDSREFPNYTSLSRNRVRDLNFYVPMEIHKCRVIEVWEKRAFDVIKVYDEADGNDGIIWEGTIEELEQIAAERFAKYEAEGIPMEEVPRIKYEESVVFKWIYRFITPWGHVIREGISPYKNFTHPFVIQPYPLISGEVYGYIEDLWDTQDQFNRIFTHMDFIMGTSAKNTLVVDEASLNGQSPEEIAEEYRRVGGVLILKLKDGAKIPTEIKNHGIDRAIFEIMNIYTKLMQDISGVQPSLMGQSAGSSVPASRFIAEAQHSTINLKGLLDFFASVRKKRDLKVLQMIVHFYKHERYLEVSGDGSNEEKLYNPELAEKYGNDLNLTIAKGGDSPVYKAMSDELLKDMAMKGLIGIEHFLKHTDYSFSKPLLEDIQNAKEQVNRGGNPANAINMVSDSVQQNRA